MKIAFGQCLAVMRRIEYGGMCVRWDSVRYCCILFVSPLYLKGKEGLSDSGLSIRVAQLFERRWLKNPKMARTESFAVTSAATAERERQKRRR